MDIDNGVYWCMVGGMNKNECPVCKVEMVGYVGNKMYPFDPHYGYTWYCENNKCSAQEVFGHGKNEKEAYEIVLAKFVKRVDKKKD